MVWGMNIPPGSNGFYLEGDFEEPRPVASCGWRERLKDHYHTEMTENERALFDDDHQNGAHWYACHAVRKFALNHEPKSPQDGPSAAPIADHEIPRYFMAQRSPKSLASLARLAGNVLVVQDSLKTFIEWLEPGVHRFFPIEIRLPRGKIHPEQYHILVIGRHLDSFSPERSAKDSFKTCVPGLYAHSESPPCVRKLAFRREGFGDAHLWRERSLLGFLTCFSDRLQAEIADAGLSIPKHVPMIEV